MRVFSFFMLPPISCNLTQTLIPVENLISTCAEWKKVSIKRAVKASKHIQGNIM